MAVILLQWCAYLHTVCFLPMLFAAPSDKRHILMTIQMNTFWNDLAEIYPIFSSFDMFEKALDKYSLSNHYIRARLNV